MQTADPLPPPRGFSLSASGDRYEESTNGASKDSQQPARTACRAEHGRQQPGAPAQQGNGESGLKLAASDYGVISVNLP